MPRCNDCKQFVGVEELDPEVSVDLQDNTISGTVRIVNACNGCGKELQEATFDVEVTLNPESEEEITQEQKSCEHEWDLNEVETERTVREEPPNAKRRVKFYGAEVSWVAACTKCHLEVGVEWEDSLKASHMEAME